MPEKIDFNAPPLEMPVDEGEDYELIPEREVKDLREELKRNKEFDIMPTKRLHISINDLNSKIERLIGIFEEASQNIKKEEGGLSFQDKMKPLIEKMNKILEQNSEIAEGIVALADVIKDFRTDLETKGVLVSENKVESQVGEEPAPLFQSNELRPFFQRVSPPQKPTGEQSMPIPPSPFGSPQPPSSPPPVAPPKKRLFGL